MTSPNLPPEPIKTSRVRPWNQMAHSLEESLNAAVAQGARVNPASRLRMYVKHVLADGRDFAASQRLERMSQIRSEVEQIVSALDHLRAPPEVEGWAKLLERVQAGTLFAETHHDQAREAQTELVMAAAMRAAGAKVTLCEPDGRAEFRGSTVHFAAKRPNSEKNLEKLVRGGRSQLARAGGSGVLFLDFSQVAAEHDKVVQVADYDEAHAAIKPRLDASIERLGSRVREWVHANPSKSKNMLAVMGLVRARFVIPTNDEYGWHHGTMHRIIIGHMTPTIEDIPAWFKEFADSFGQINQMPRQLVAPDRASLIEPRGALSETRDRGH